MEEYFMDLKEGLSKATLALLVLSILTLAAIIMPVANANTATIGLSPTQGPVGTAVSVIGYGFSSGGSVSITFDTTKVTSAYPGMFGRINAVFSIPSVSPGTYTVTATGASGSYATATFTVTQKLSTATLPTATIGLSSTQGPVGTTVSVIGYGFNSGGSVSINFDATNVAAISADASGGISAVFTIPSVSSGMYAVTATGAGGTYAAATFTVAQTLSSTAIGLSSTQGPVGARAGFWSPLVIVVIVAAVMAFIILVTFVYKRRGKQESLLDEERPLYKPELSASSKKPVVIARSNQPTTVTSRYNQPASYTQQLSKKPTVTAKYNQPTSYSQQPPSTKICRHCKQAVRDDYNVCPHCRKRLR